MKTANVETESVLQERFTEFVCDTCNEKTTYGIEWMDAERHTCDMRLCKQCFLVDVDDLRERVKQAEGLIAQWKK